MARGLAGLASKPLYAQTQAADVDGQNWPGTLQGRHRQVVDAYGVNERFALGFAHASLAFNKSATAVVVLRHDAFPIGLGHAMWEKYKIGESFKIIDPETKAPAIKNPSRPKPGVLLLDDFAIDRFLEKGVVFGACNVALLVDSKTLADNAGVSAEESRKRMGGQRGPRDHDHSIGNMGCEPSPGSGLHILRWRLTARRRRP